MHMYRSGFPTRVMGHPVSSVGSTHVAFRSSKKKNTAGRVLKQRDSQGPKAKGDLEGHLDPHCSKCGLWASSIDITWTLLEMQNLRAHL